MQADSVQTNPLHTLYILTFANGKRYVGQTIRTMQIRISEHRKAARSGSRLPVHCAWRKHGEPQAEVLGYFGSQEELNQAEITAIRDMSTLSPGGYNVGHGGETSPTVNPEVAKRISEALKGREFTQETRSRMSAAAKRRGVAPETLARLAHASRNTPRKPASDEKRRNLSVGIKAAWADPVKRERLVAARKIAWETRRKQKEMAVSQ